MAVYIALDEEKVQKVVEGWRDTGVSLSELLEAMEPVEVTPVIWSQDRGVA